MESPIDDHATVGGSRYRNCKLKVSKAQGTSLFTSKGMRNPSKNSPNADFLAIKSKHTYMKYLKNSAWPTILWNERDNIGYEHTQKAHIQRVS